jgi:subtilisin family serine protease
MLVVIPRFHLVVAALALVTAAACSSDGDPVTPPLSEGSRLTTAGSSDPEEILVRLVPSASIAAVNARHGTRTINALAEERVFLLAPPPDRSADDVLADMVTDPDISSAGLNVDLEAPEADGGSSMAFADPSTEPADIVDQNALERIRAPAAWRLSKGRGVVVAVLDTGIDPRHPALVRRIASGGADLIDGDSNPRDVRDHVDSDGDGRVDEAYGHGTFIAALILAVAPEAKILPIRFLDSDGVGTTFDAARAIHLAKVAGADVVNMSFGVGEETDVLEELIEENHDDDGELAFAASAGNRSSSTPQHPAAEDDVLGVAATDARDRRASFSNYGRWVAVAAPGVGLLSAFPDGRYAKWSGTSFAAALVSGVAALVRSAAVGAEAETVHQVIIETAVPLSDPRISPAGRVDARAAVERMQALAAGADGDGDGDDDD